MISKTGLLSLFPKKQNSSSTHVFDIEDPNVPMIVDLPLRFLEESEGFKQEGIFVTPLNKKTLHKSKVLKKDLEKGGTKEFKKCKDPLVMANAVTMFLQALEQPLCETEADCFTASMGIKMEEAKLNSIFHVIQMMPVGSRSILGMVIGTFSKVLQNIRDNKVDIDKLVEIYAPILLGTKELAEKTQKVLKFLITHHETFFGDKQMTTPLAIPTIPTEPPPKVSTKNSPSIPKIPPPPDKPLPVPEETKVDLVQATHKFTAMEPGDLSFEVGDVIVVVEKENEDWWVGNLNGVTGIFPCNFTKSCTDPELTFTIDTNANSDSIVKDNYPSVLESTCVVGEEEREPVYVIAMHYFISEEPDEIQFERGDTILLINKHDDPWWFGEHKGKRGLFPANYVRELSKEEMGLGAGQTLQVLDTIDEPPTNHIDKDVIYLEAVHPYSTEEPGDLTFNKGDIIKLLDKEDDPWWNGEFNGKVGIFPSNYVIELNHKMMKNDA